jgi:hypothetical protein
VLQGELPHRDFDEPYTGLLTLVHAFAFLVGGLRLTALRLPLFIATLFWLAALFALLRRSTEPRVAAALTLLALLWSVPNYPASIPSWYNLFLATAALLAVVRWCETGSARWLVLGGIACGVSFLVKLSGVLPLAGVLLFVVYATGSARDAPTPRPGLPGVVVTAGLVLFVALLWRAIAPYHLPRVVIHFVLPGAALAAALIIREWREVPHDEERLRRLAAACGVSLPVVLFLGVYAVSGGLPRLWDGVFIAPLRRLTFANLAPPAPYWILASAPLVLLLRPRADASDARWRRVVAPVVALAFAGSLWLAYRDGFTYRIVWHSLRSLIPVVALLAAAMVAVPRLWHGWSALDRSRCLAVVTVTSMASLIQFPFAAPLYFLYVAPLLLVALVMFVRGTGRTPPSLAWVTGAFYGVFVVALATPGGIGLASHREPPEPRAPLASPRGGLRVPAREAALYAALLSRLEARAGGGGVWAGPDAPEVYFLGGHANHTRLIFDFLAGDRRDMADLSRPEVRAVVINLRPQFSPPFSPEQLDTVRQRFPRGERIAWFELRWR